MAKKQNKVQPVEEIRIGSIKAAIWRNEGESGPRLQCHLPTSLPHRGWQVARAQPVSAATTCWC